MTKSNNTDGGGEADCEAADDAEDAKDVIEKNDLPTVEETLVRG